MNTPTKRAVSVLLLALLVRIIGAGLTTATNFNPDSQKDAVEFGTTAEAIARGVSRGNPYFYLPDSIDFVQFVSPLISVDIYYLWGTFLAPFWLLPGPSGFYARLGNAFLGAYAVFNVYLIAQYYHSHRAGVVAALPLTFYPSIVAIHSTILREAILLFGITTAARMWLIHSRRRTRVTSYALASGVLYIALLQRVDNAIIYATAIAVALAVYTVESDTVPKPAIGLGAALAPPISLLSLPIVRKGIEFLARTRELRARGRTVYLTELIPHTVPEFVAFSWIGAAYFLYAPFPWMIETVPDLIVSLEGLVSLGFTVAAVWGVRSLGQKNTPATAGLVAGFVVAVVLYGVGTVNYGTGMRHRQMFLWVIFLFGGIGIAEHVTVKWPFQGNSDTSAEVSAETQQ